MSDPERLLRLINNEERPWQFVFAGKGIPGSGREIDSAATGPVEV